MENLKVSIITVVFNAKDTIGNTIESVQSQSYDNIEYLIIDGGSTDGTCDIIEKYLSFIDTYISEPDRGLYDAMNKAIDLSSGEIIGILNADDVFYDNFVISGVADFLFKSPEIDAAIGDIIQCDKSGKRIRHYSSKYWSPAKLRFGFMPPHPSIFFRRELFGAFGKYRIDLKSGADYELLVRYFIKHRITWAYHHLMTTTMLIGGISSSGYKSYSLITGEIIKALELNKIKFCRLFIYFRVVWKLFGFLYKKN